MRDLCLACARTAESKLGGVRRQYGNIFIPLNISVRDSGDQGINDRRRRDVVIVDCEQW